MSLNFIPCNDPKLNLSSEKIAPEKILSSENQKFIREFLTFCGYEATPSPKPRLTRMVGCAAPQVGVLKQIIVVDTAIHPEKRNFHQMDFHVLINPRIIWSSNEKETYPESCYSVPLCYTGLIPRSIAVVVEAYNEKADKVRRRYEGYTARVVQHEIDHLKGIRFPQKVEQKEQLHKISFTKREDILNYRSNWRDWHLYATKQELNRLIKGQYANL